MKGIYRADPTTKVFTSSDVVNDDYSLQANETFENPSGKKWPPKLQGTNWLDATDVEHQAYLDAEKQVNQMPGRPQGPSNDQKMIMNQQSDITQLQKTVMTQQANMTQMQKLIMTQQAQITELKKGSN